MTTYPVVYGYVRANTDQPELVAAWQEELRAWCAKEGWHLGAIFTDTGGALDVEERIGFRGLLHALALPFAKAAVVLSPTHLSPRDAVVTALVSQIRRTGSAVKCKRGSLPDAAIKHCKGQPELTT